MYRQIFRRMIPNHRRAAPETPAQEVLPPAEGLRGKEKTQDQTKLNFHYNLWETEKGGVKTRYQWNIDAICTLKQIEAENRLATQEEQTVLSKFVGWGGLSQAFDENNAGVDQRICRTERTSFR